MHGRTQGSNEYILAISQVYEKVICCVRIDDKLSNYFNSTIGVKQRRPLSPTLSGLCIDKLKKMATTFVKEECVEKVAIGNVVIMLLSICTKAYEDIGKYLHAY